MNVSANPIHVRGVGYRNRTDAIALQGGQKAGVAAPVAHRHIGSKADSGLQRRPHSPMALGVSAQPGIGIIRSRRQTQLSVRGKGKDKLIGALVQRHDPQGLGRRDTAPTRHRRNDGRDRDLHEAVNPANKASIWVRTKVSRSAQSK